MTLLSKLGGIACVIVGFLLCMPAICFAWDRSADHQHHVDFGGISFVLVGGLSFTGTSAWLFLAVSTLTGTALIVLGIYLLVSRSES
jgi:hypothetical protein